MINTCCDKAFLSTFGFWGFWCWYVFGE